MADDVRDKIILRVVSVALSFLIRQRLSANLFYVHAYLVTIQYYYMLRVTKL